MRWGISVPCQPPFDTAKMVSGIAGQLGFESVWLWDHLLGLWHTEAHAQMPLAELIPEGDAFFDPFVFATALGQHYDGAIGTSVTCTTRRHPAVIAQSALSVQNFLPSHDFILGVGSGEAEGLVPFGFDYTKPVGRFEETVQILRHFFDSPEPLDFQGEHFTIKGGRMALRPPEGHRPPQIWAAAHGPRMLDICGRSCDGWLPAFPQTPDEYAVRVARIRRAADEAGRPHPVMAAMFFPICGESRDKIVHDANQSPCFKSIGLMLADTWLQRFGGTSHLEPGSRGVVDTVPHYYPIEQVKAFGDTVTVDGWTDGGWAMGNAEELTEFYRRFAEAGCEYVVAFDTTAALYGVAALEGAIATNAQVIAAVG